MVSPANLSQHRGGHAAEAHRSGHLFCFALLFLKQKRPKAFLFENVQGLWSHHSELLLEFLTALKSLKDPHSGAPLYNIHCRCLNSKHWLPQTRGRLYIVGILRTARVERFHWPTPPATVPSLDSLAFVPPCRDQACNPDMRSWGVVQLRNMRFALKSIARLGGDPTREPWVVDLDSSPSRPVVPKLGVSHCITRSRAMGGGYYVTSWGRRMCVDELARLQGFPDGRIVKPLGVSPRHFAGMFGNAMTIPVVADILRKICVAIGATLLDHHLTFL